MNTTSWQCDSKRQSDAAKVGDTELQRLIIAYLQEREFASFAELEQYVHGVGFDARGSVSIALAAGGPNLILWAGMSEIFSAAVSSLIDNERLFVHPCRAFGCWGDGRAIDLPLVNRPPAGGYKRPHWLPVVLRLNPVE